MAYEVQTGRKTHTQHRHGRQGTNRQKGTHTRQARQTRCKQIERHMTQTRQTRYKQVENHALEAEIHGRRGINRQKDTRDTDRYADKIQTGRKIYKNETDQEKSIHKVQLAGLTYADAVRARQKSREARAHVTARCVGARAVFTAKPHVALVKVLKDRHDYIAFVKATVSKDRHASHPSKSSKTDVYCLRQVLKGQTDLKVFKDKTCIAFVRSLKDRQISRSSNINISHSSRPSKTDITYS